MKGLRVANATAHLLLLAACGASAPPANDPSTQRHHDVAPRTRVIAPRDTTASGGPVCYRADRHDPDEDGAAKRCVPADDIRSASPCPASYADAQGVCGMHASRGLAQRCPYAEGECTCTTPSRCSGVPPPLPRPTDLLQWVCVPKRPPSRTDGCPNEAPNHGAPCQQAGKSCSYGTCGGALAQCNAGRWEVTMVPPPP